MGAYYLWSSLNIHPNPISRIAKYFTAAGVACFAAELHSLHTASRLAAQIGIGAVRTLRGSTKYAANTICAVIVCGCGLDCCCLFVVRWFSRQKRISTTCTQMKQHIRTYFLDTKQTTTIIRKKYYCDDRASRSIYFQLPLFPLCVSYLHYLDDVLCAQLPFILVFLIGSTRMALNQLFQVATEHKVGI